MNFFKKVRCIATTTLLTVFTLPVIADGLPSAPDTDSNSGKKGYTGEITDYVMDGVVLLLLLMGTFALIRVAQNILTTYGEISDGKATYRELGGSLVVGIVVLSGVIYLLGEAADIFGVTF
jgi:integrating conjugative element membrane protein (TIGR03745 family)